jgi:hypothetical protein
MARRRQARAVVGNYASQPLVRDNDGACYGNAAAVPLDLEQRATAVVSACQTGGLLTEGQGQDGEVLVPRLEPWYSRYSERGGGGPVTDRPDSSAQS